MAELTAFSYHPGTSALHRFDVRMKIACLVGLSLAGLGADAAVLVLLTAFILAVVIAARLPLRAALGELRYFLLLMVLVFIARVLAADGSTGFAVGPVFFSYPGAYSGALICWRLILVVFFGLAFVGTTRPSQIKAAVQWYLKPLPLVPEKRVAVMLSLLLRFVPLILEQAGKTAAAQQARGVENRKNPVYRLTKFSIPLMRRTFESADKLVFAMEARCFSENRTDTALQTRPGDWLWLLAVACLGGLLFLL